MTPLVVLALLAGAPSPAFLAKFKAVKAPFTLTADSAPGPELSDQELAAAYGPAPKRDPGTKAFAMGRLGDLLFVRYRHETDDVRRLTDEVMMLGKDGVAGTGVLGAQELAELVGTKATLVVSAGRKVTWASTFVEQVEGADAVSTLVWKGTIGAEGSVVYDAGAYPDVGGTFVDGMSHESLVFAVDPKPRVFYFGSNKKPIDVKVEGAFTARALTLRFKDGKPHPLAVDEARKTIVCTNPDGTTQTFARQ